MNGTRLIACLLSLIVLSSVAACGKDEIRTTCDEPQPYQSAVAGKRIVVPEGLEPLDELKEMPIPKSNTPPRPAGAKCIEYPPAVSSGS